MQLPLYLQLMSLTEGVESYRKIKKSQGACPLGTSEN
jgi:hypothetical protein